MLNSQDDARSYKDAAYGAFAALTKGLSSPRRLELLDVLAQRPRGVEALAAQVGQPVPNVSQHLQVLRRAGVVETRRDGTHIEYRLAPGVGDVLAALRRLAEARSAELAQARQSWLGADGAAESIDRETLQRRLREGTAVLVDVREPAEFAHAHLSGARNLPIAQLPHRLDELPADLLIVATCRGPYCVFSAQAVALLQASDRRAVRFDDGLPEWQLDGAALETGP
jgi:rhodanese-related sulfurtransferase